MSESCGGATVRIEPVGQGRQPRQRLADGAAQNLARQARRHRIDRLDQRQASASPASAMWSGWTMEGRPLNHSMRPRDDDVLADRQRLFEIGGMGVEEGQRDLAGLVMGEDAVGHGAVAARRRLVAVDAQVERDDRALRRDARCPAGCAGRSRVCGRTKSRSPTRARPIAEVGRHDFLDQIANLRPDAVERGDGANSGSRTDGRIVSA